MGAGSVVGVLIGASLLVVDKHTLKALLGVFLLVATLYLTLHTHLNGSRRASGDLNMRRCEMGPPS